MQAGPARYVSVSELYSTDEVELLLDEIRELEPTSCRGEDVQDFEIAGSGCGAGAGGRSPAGTELTERSWDSHAHYRRAPPPRPRALAPLYCRLRHLLTPSGAATLLLVACSAGACACVWAGVGLRVARAPLAGRVRVLLLGALTSLLLHSALLVLHVTRLSALLPLDWNKLGACTSLWSAASLGAGGALTLAGVAGGAVGARGRLVLAGAALALAGAALAAGLALAGARRVLRRRARAWPGGPGAAYRAVPPAPACAGAAPEPRAGPSSARDPPL